MADGEQDDTERIQRQGYGRRETDRRETDWHRPGFWLSVLGFLLTIALVLLSAIWNKVSAIESAVAASNIANSVQAKDLETQRREFDEFKRSQKAADDIRDTYIANTRERLIKLESQAK